MNGQWKRRQLRVDRTLYETEAELKDAIHKTANELLEVRNEADPQGDVIECQLACEASFTARDFERATVGSCTARYFRRATAGAQFAACHPLIYVCG